MLTSVFWAQHARWHVAPMRERHASCRRVLADDRRVCSSPAACGYPIACKHTEVLQGLPCGTFCADIRSTAM